MSESGGAGCFARVSSDILSYLANDTETNIALEQDKIRVTGDHSMYVKDAVKRLTRLERAFVSLNVPLLNGIET